MFGLIRQNILPIVLGGTGLVLILFGLFQFMSNQKNEEVKFEPTASASEDKAQQIVVDIEGAVIKPGIYKLSVDSRFVDALAAAGGLSEEANRDWVEKNLNLAKKVSDGLKIYIPRVGEEILSGSNSGTAGSVVNSTININTASESELDSLPGVGVVTAQKIISARPYSSVDELLSRKIVGESIFDKIKDQISAN